MDIIVPIIMLLFIGNACRTKAIAVLAARFSSPADADRHYNAQHPAVAASASHQVPAGGRSHPSLSPSEVFQECKELLSCLQAQEQLHVLCELFAWFDFSQQEPPLFPSNFLELAVQGAQHLHRCGRLNVIYLMAKCLGTMNKSDSLMPARIMPMGLIEYTVNFFSANSIQQV